MSNSIFIIIIFTYDNYDKITNNKKKNNKIK
jgi:hypothetical protein